jgi:hypothetical protein
MSGAEKTMTGFEIRQIVDPSTDPRATVKQVGPAFERPPISAKAWPSASRVPVTI